MSSRISFIRQLYDLNENSKIADSYARYLEIGRMCKISDYLDGHAANYLSDGAGKWEDNKPFPSGDGFIAINVEAGEAGQEMSPFIPFFSIARNGRVDSPELRETVWEQLRDADTPGFLTCPVFMNEFGLDKILLKISICEGAVTGIEALDLAAFNEDNNEEIRGYLSYIGDYILNYQDRSFLVSWCKPFLDADRELFCDIRAVDRDEQFTAHSFSAVILSTTAEIKDWRYAYGEDVMNVINIVKSVLIKDMHKAQETEAVKSAISAIMSRNMSHNLGSHYLYYTKNYLETLAASCGLKGPDVRGAAKVLAYMQARMDYLATIVSNDRYPAGAVNFKAQIYNEFTVDDFSRRHFASSQERVRRTTNFLLTNLVLSENFTRPPILRNSYPFAVDSDKTSLLSLQIKLWNGKSYDTYTGAGTARVLRKERQLDNALSKINLSLPGGTMSCHAFFNILENLIRNSAKYFQEDFRSEGLVFTIAIRRSETVPKAFDFIIYDNKRNAARVLPVVTGQLASLRILDSRGVIEKSAKGLKEMLFSSVWLRSSMFPEDSFADIIDRIQSELDKEKKLSLIARYGFRYVAVSGDGLVGGEPREGDNLGLLLTLPEFDFLDLPETAALPVDPEQYASFRASAGVVEDDEEAALAVYKFKTLLDRRFAEQTGGDIDSMCLWLGDSLDMRKLPKDHSKIIYFERHLSTKLGGLAPYMDYAYVDSVSGGNFTISLKTIFERGVTGRGQYKTWQDKLYGLKIKESALTRITIVDERLFNSMKDAGPSRELELTMKNIRILNARPAEEKPEDMFDGNAFRDGSSRTHFLSIHLGLIEKVLKGERGAGSWSGSTVEERAALFMDELSRYFGNPHISVHSGRGNFSKELEGSLASYPFISLSAVENAFGNSKFLLSQLFYTTVYKKSNT